MRAAHTVEQVRGSEADLMRQLPEGALMQRAAAGLATAIADLLGTTYGARVLLVVGSGDNGGDALWAGARLAQRGAAVEAVLLSEQPRADGLAAFRSAGGQVVRLVDSARPDVLVDGIVGIGGQPGLRLEAEQALAHHRGVTVVAVDVPSGVEVDTGRLPSTHVRADLTVTFGTHKIAHLVDPASTACGMVHLVDLGLTLPEPPLTALQAVDVAALLPQPESADHKYTRGVVGVRAGSAAYPGAAVLCTAGAGVGLAGMVRYVGSAADDVRARHPEVVVGAGQVQAWVVGSGGDDDAEQALAEALADGVPTLVDADGLRHVEPGSGELVLTPHAGELARMLGLERAEVEADGLAVVRRAAREYDATVLLKGRRTLVARPDGVVRVTATGVPWLAVAGAGDVLAGVIGSLLAAGLAPFDAASVGSWLHGSAAALASDGGPLRAYDVVTTLPDTVRALLR